MAQKEITRAERFVEAFLESGDAEAAALAAGYSGRRAKRAGEKLLREPAVQTALRQAWKTQPRVYPITEAAILVSLPGFPDSRAASCRSARR